MQSMKYLYFQGLILANLLSFFRVFSPKTGRKHENGPEFDSRIKPFNVNQTRQRRAKNLIQFTKKNRPKTVKMRDKRGREGT